MRRLVLIGGLVLALGFAGPLITMPELPGHEVRLVAAQEADDAGLIRELAERLLAPPYAGQLESSESVQLMPGMLPADLPVDLPIPERGRLLGSAARSFGGELSSVDIVIDAPGASIDALRLYQDALEAQGWYIPPIARSDLQGGFQSTQTVYSGPYCQSEAGPWLTISAYALEQGGTDVRIYFDLTNPGPCSDWLGPDPSLGADLLPRLYAPDGVEVETMGGSGGPGRWTSEAVARTSLSVSSLEAHFAGQLLAAGWTRVDGRTDGPIAWSLWRLPGEGSWQGFLYALEGPGENRRSLYVKVESAAPADGRWAPVARSARPPAVGLGMSEPAVPEPAFEE